MLLRVTAPKTRGHAGFVAGAEVLQTDDGWEWGRVAPVLKWFEGEPVHKIGDWLHGPAARGGWTYEWIR